MRVDFRIEVNPGDEMLEIPWENAATGSRYLDLREDPGAIEQVKEARQHAPLRSFLAAVNSADSVFATARCRASGSASDPNEYVSQIELIFAPGLEDFNYERENFESLGKDLFELLAHDAAAETLRAWLCLRRCHFRDADRWGYCLAVGLSARGESSGQAELRWGLAVARVQQALLFTSRVIRHHLAQSGSTAT
jgi:hypothetical protein